MLGSKTNSTKYIFATFQFPVKIPVKYDEYLLLFHEQFEIQRCTVSNVVKLFLLEIPTT